MIAPNDTPIKNPALPAKSEAKKPASAPTVETVGTYQPGQKVKHLNGAIFEVRFQNKEGVALVGVANMVHPSALKPA